MGSSEKSETIYTVGTSTRPFSEFLYLLQSYQVTTIADVRIYPYSKRFPHFSKESLEQLLPPGGVRYVYLGKDLGGYRCGGYEAYMQSPEFARGVEALETVGRRTRVAFMCCERVPWKCHRRFIASELQRRGWQVVHIIDKDRTWEPVMVQGS